MHDPVVLINVFEVSSGREKDFLEWWQHCSEALQQEPGFIDAKLHRNLKASARFQFINIAHWETAEALERARIKNKDVLQAIAVEKGIPGLYEIALQY